VSSFSFLFVEPRRHSSWSQSDGHRFRRSFPTRRSSDLAKAVAPKAMETRPSGTRSSGGSARRPVIPMPRSWPGSHVDSRSGSARSEEHTSELQSRENLVCRLLLERKKVMIFARDVELLC